MLVLKSWESIDLGRDEVEQGHLAQFKGDHWVSAKRPRLRASVSPSLPLSLPPSSSVSHSLIPV